MALASSGEMIIQLTQYQIIFRTAAGGSARSIGASPARSVRGTFKSGIVEATPEEKAKSAKTAMLASRTNTLLSLPMLLSMVIAQNLYNI